MKITVDKEKFENKMRFFMGYRWDEYLEQLMIDGIISFENGKYSFDWVARIPDAIHVRAAEIKDDVVDTRSLSYDLIHVVPSNGLIVLDPSTTSSPRGSIKGYLVIKEDKSLCNKLSKYVNLYVDDNLYPRKAFGQIVLPTKNLLQSLIGNLDRQVEPLKPSDSKELCNLVKIGANYGSEAMGFLHEFYNAYQIGKALDDAIS